MPFTAPSSHAYLERLMDLSAVLADFTQSPELAAQIPACLAAAFQLDAVTLAVVRQTDESQPRQLVLLHSTLPGAADNGAFAPCVLAIEQEARSCGEQLAARNRFHEGHDAVASLAYAAGSDWPGFPGASVFADPLDDDHRLCVIIHRRGNDPFLTAAQNGGLMLVAGLLAKLLRCMLSWQNCPEILGSDFQHLTDREWVVLRQLDSDAGEKQLAERLSLSPHTLHSHIKSIYRKVGVQGRLPLLQRLNTAVRDLRKTSITRTATNQDSPALAAVGD